ncbi:FxsA family protein [Limoniibacter endophyticus]|uniref:Membrane protein FxsA n=1 Tax=Limoniibacter endophyticus TaxID=1565040 RepID=A0A8J3DIB4_9HYPH|nr:FxsA family protein [Limoniibacter endophyticus]GHC74428.1 membrane protein FxsA [Limoniibacter endophyticus]
MPFLLLMLLPLLEIAGFVIVGGAVGVLGTIGLVILSAIVGILTLRSQGLQVLTRVRTEVEAGEDPSSTLLHGFFITISGILLIIPGFVTDITGLLLFLPPVRNFLWRSAGRNMVVRRYQYGSSGGRRSGETIIDLEADNYRSEPSSNGSGKQLDDGRD